MPTCTAQVYKDDIIIIPTCTAQIYKDDIIIIPTCTAQVERFERQNASEKADP